MSTLQNAFSVLADEGVLVVRQERTAVVAGDPPGHGEPGQRPWRPGPGPRLQAVRMSAACMQADESDTIRQIHSILSGAFVAARELFMGAENLSWFATEETACS